MTYKLIVLDVDGTMLNSNREISKRTIQTLRKVQQMGIRVALASGRPTYGILPLARDIDLGVYEGYHFVQWSTGDGGKDRSDSV